MKQAVQGLKLIGQNWVFSYRSQGRAKRMTIGKFPAVSPKVASKGASILAGQICCGRCPASERRAARAVQKCIAAPIRDHVERVAAQYLKHAMARTRESTWTETKRVFDREILPAWKGRRLSEITKADVRGLIDRIAKRGAPVSANRCLASIKAFFNWAISVDVITGASPAAAIRPPAPETPRERVLTDDELGAVWRASLELAEYGAIVRLLILTGQRRSEVANLSWAEIDFAAKVWTLPAHRAKNGRQHSVPLSDAAIAILESLPRNSGSAVFEPISFSQSKAKLAAHCRECRHGAFMT